MSDFETSRVGLLLADLLMGAAYSDHKLEKREAATVRAKLRAWLDLEEITPDLEERLESFDPETFDLESTVALLGVEGAEEARKVLELVAAVHDADDELDLDEDAYLRQLAKHLGVEDEAFADLRLEIVSVDDLKAGLEKLSSKPPPIPER